MGSGKYSSKSDRLAAVVKKETEEELRKMDLIPYTGTRELVPYHNISEYKDLSLSDFIEKTRENAVNQTAYTLNIQEDEISSVDEEDVNNRNPFFDDKKSGEPGIRTGYTTHHLTKSLDDLADEDEGIIDFS
ncbi:hypothetical protein GF361_02605 [Candidatus Woesearchaeota archaeon]|nr:hypothetical protein [Candidatus Woesearchaeota archaeon]